MHTTFQFAHPLIFALSLVAVVLLAAYRFFYFKPAAYTYPLARWLQEKFGTSNHIAPKVLFFLRLASLAILAFLMGKPQLVDMQSKISVEGVDMVLVLDVSGSMQLFDDPAKPEARIEIAKREAIRFIDRRPDDPMGLVLFGKEAVSRVPVTLDHKLLKTIVSDTQLGVIPHDGTMLSKALLVACARLKKSNAKSKVIILLTDGAPTPGDSPPQAAVALAQQLGIKIYTIGIGADVAYMMDPFFGAVPVDSSFNRQLLKQIAEYTKGHYFEARNAGELREIYDMIDQLEKTRHETPIFANIYDWFVPFVWLVILLLGLEIVCSALIWRVL